MLPIFDVKTTITRIITGIGIHPDLAQDMATSLCERMNLDDLLRATPEEIVQRTTLTQPAADAVSLALELGSHLYYAQRRREVTRIISAHTVYELLGREMGALVQEELRVLLLNVKLDILRIETVYRGTIDRSNTRVAEVLRPAILANSPRILIVHNHPSSSPPSDEDHVFTLQLLAGARLLDIEVLDHVVIGQGVYYSCRERGLWEKTTD